MYREMDGRIRNHARNYDGISNSSGLKEPDFTSCNLVLLLLYLSSSSFDVRC